MEFLRTDPLSLSIWVAFLGIVIALIVRDVRRYAHTRIPRESENTEIVTWRYHLRTVSLSIMSILLTIALLGPISPWDTSDEREGSEIVWLLDVSRSMDVRDVPGASGNISRLERAKELISTFMSKHPEHRYGLTIFSGDTRLVSPLTTSTDSVLTFLGSIDSSSISEGGSDFRKAIELGMERFSGSGSTNTRAFILLSDGGDAEDAPDPTTIKNLFHRKNVRLSTVGLGSEKGWPIPIGTDLMGAPLYKRRGGETVISSLSEANLQTIAKIWGGTYISGSDGDNLTDALTSVSREIIRSDGTDRSSDIGRLFVIGALPFFLVSLLPYRRKKIK